MSQAEYDSWRNASCQPNYFRNVVAQNSSCPPYRPLHPPPRSTRPPPLARHERHLAGDVSRTNHDTIGMVAIDTQGQVAAGTSTNGASHKVAGCDHRRTAAATPPSRAPRPAHSLLACVCTRRRVGDSPIMGAGAYADAEVGGAAATGDGDVMMRFLPAYQAVESMRLGADVRERARQARRRPHPVPAPSHSPSRHVKTPCGASSASTPPSKGPSCA